MQKAPMILIGGFLFYFIIEILSENFKLMKGFYDAAKLCGVNLVASNLRHYPDEDFVVTAREFLELV